MSSESNSEPHNTIKLYQHAFVSDHITLYTHYLLKNENPKESVLAFWDHIALVNRMNADERLGCRFGMFDS